MLDAISLTSYFKFNCFFIQLSIYTVVAIIITQGLFTSVKCINKKCITIEIYMKIKCILSIK